MIHKESGKAATEVARFVREPDGRVTIGFREPSGDVLRIELPPAAATVLANHLAPLITVLPPPEAQPYQPPARGGILRGEPGQPAHIDGEVVGEDVVGETPCWFVSTPAGMLRLPKASYTEDAARAVAQRFAHWTPTSLPEAGRR